jgi:hypothetical protein
MNHFWLPFLLWFVALNTVLAQPDTTAFTPNKQHNTCGMQSQLKTISTSELKDAYGNVFKIETKELPQVRLGGRRLKNVPLSFAARSSDIPMKVFGNGLLRRFNLFVDYQKGMVYMKPNGSWGAPFSG